MRSSKFTLERSLVAPYCAIPRDYLSDTPLLRAMGLLVSQHGQLGAIPPPPFLSVSPLESMRGEGAIPPVLRGISAILVRYPMRKRQMGAIPPSAILSQKGIARYGGVSRIGPLRKGAGATPLCSIFGPGSKLCGEQRHLHVWPRWSQRSSWVGARQIARDHVGVVVTLLAQNPKSQKTVVSKPWFEIRDEAEVKLRLERGKKEVKKR